MKKKLIATAVAGALVAPAAMAASHANVSPYFRINNALEIRDQDGPQGTTADIRNISSRIGIRGSADVGNGLTVFGQYEFSTFTDREGQAGGRGGINDTRIGIVGIRGSFGAVSVGNQWSAFYNTVGTHMDPTYTVGYVLYSSVMGGVYRESNAVKYANSFGAVHVEVDARFAAAGENAAGGADTEKIGADNGEDFLDGFGVGLSVGVTDAITLAAAYDSELVDVPGGDDTDRLGLAAKASLGAFWVSVGYMNVDTGPTDNDLFTIYGGTSIGENTSAYIGYQQGEQGSTDPAQFILHLNHKIGGGPLRVFYEGTLYDDDGFDRSGDGLTSNDDFTQHLFGMRIDM